jgi:hypothetical protein
MVLGACALRLPVTAMSLGGSSGSVAAVRLGSVTNGQAIREIQGLHQPAIRRQMVILAVIPPGTTRKTRGDQADGTADLTSKDATRPYLLDGAEPTHNRSVAGSRPASPTQRRRSQACDTCFACRQEAPTDSGQAPETATSWHAFDASSSPCSARPPPPATPTRPPPAARRPKPCAPSTASSEAQPIVTSHLASRRVGRADRNVTASALRFVTRDDRICESSGGGRGGGSLPGFDVRHLGMTQNGSGALRLPW